jgi:hypothetical protein
MGIVPSWQDVADRWMKACIEHESTIADLRERHAEFVRGVRDAAQRAEDLAICTSLTSYLANEILALCAAELGKEWK